MNTYTIKMIARTIGSIGCMYPITATRQAASKQGAIEALYNEYEHIQVISVTAS